MAPPPEHLERSLRRRLGRRLAGLDRPRAQPNPHRPNLYALPGGTPAPQAGMTRADAHMAALLAAVDEPTGTE